MKPVAIPFFRFQDARYLLLLGLVLLGHLAFAQQRVCGTMDHLHHQLEANPNLRYRMQAIERQTEEGIKAASHRLDRDIIIPVVVHVVYNRPEQNISDQQIYSQIQILNQDFRRRNPDQIRTPERWKSVAADTRISFKLANRDPNGLPTSGITRTSSSVEAFFVQSNGVKYRVRGGVDAWPTDQYLNIWVCNLGMGVLGYSQFPGGPPETDGVVIGYKFFGNTGVVRPPFNGGRTCTHEVGHWLNLRHIWGDGPCTVDDLVADTPPSDRPTQGCPSYRTACNGVVMSSNYMDYTDDACMNMFTFGQADRMQMLFLPGAPRASFRTSPGLVSEPAQVPAASLDVELLSPSSAKLMWAPVQGAESYNVRFKRINGNRWLSRNFSRTYVSTSGLQPCTDYEFQMEAVVNGRATGFSVSMPFRTEGCPSGLGQGGELVPSGMVVYPEASGTMTMSWEHVPGASGYRVQIKVSGSRTVRSVYTEDAATTMQGIESGKSYFWRVRADFEGESGPFSPVETFFGREGMAQMRTVSPESSALEVRPEHGLSDGPLPFRLHLSAPLIAGARIVDEMGVVHKEYSPRRLQPDAWLNIPVTGLLPGRYQVILTDPDDFSLEADVILY